MKIKRKILSLILVFCCLFSMFQFTFIAYADTELTFGKTYKNSVYDYYDDIYYFIINKPKIIKFTITSISGDPIYGSLSKHSYTKYPNSYKTHEDYDVILSYKTSSSVSYVRSLNPNNVQSNTSTGYSYSDTYEIDVGSSDFDWADYSIKVEDITPKISLSSSKFTYNGKVQKPRVTVKAHDGSNLTNGKDYTIKYSNESSKAPGEYTIKISYKGSLKGAKSETYKYTIAPKTVTDLKVSSTAKKTAKISFKKATGATGYVIYYSTSKSSGYKKLSTTSKTTITNNKLKSGKNYYFKVKAYTKTSSGKTIYSSYSNVVKQKIK